MGSGLNMGHLRSHSFYICMPRSAPLSSAVTAVVNFKRGFFRVVYLSRFESGAARIPEAARPPALSSPFSVLPLSLLSPLILCRSSPIFCISPRAFCFFAILWSSQMSVSWVVECFQIQWSPLVRSAFCPMKIDHTSGLTLHPGILFTLKEGCQ